MSPGRTFTVEQANAMLPRVREILETMRQSLHYLRRCRQRVEPGPGVDATDRAVPSWYFAAFQRLSEAERALAEDGIQIKDVETGLVDFPALDGDRPVLLCWRDGEEAVTWFHDAAAGFAGRRPVCELRRGD